MRRNYALLHYLIMILKNSTYGKWIKSSKSLKDVKCYYNKIWIKTKRNNVKNKSVKQIQFIQLRFIVITHNRKIAIWMLNHSAGMNLKLKAQPQMLNFNFNGPLQFQLCAAHPRLDYDFIISASFCFFYYTLPRVVNVQLRICKSLGSSITQWFHLVAF